MPATSSTNSEAVLDRVNSLRQQLAGLVTLDEEAPAAISWQCPELDKFMPGGGLQPGMILELLYDRQGSGATSLAMHCAKQAVEQQLGPLVVVDRGQKFYPPAAVARGIEVRDLIVVRPPSPLDGSDPSNLNPKPRRMSSAEEIWALDQALRCKSVAVVMAWLDKIDPHAYRRLQLAAEVGKTLAIFIRPAQVRAFPTWADVQLLISPRIAGDASSRRKALNQMSSSSSSKDAGRNDRSQVGPRLAPTVQRLGSKRNVKTGVVQRRDADLLASRQDTRQGTRLVRATLLRQRGRAGSSTIEGTSLDLMFNENVLQVGEIGTREVDVSRTNSAVVGKENRNEASTLHMAPRMAHPATCRRSTGA